MVGQRQALARPVAPDEGVAHDDVLAGVPLAHVGKQTTLHQGGQERRQPGMLRLPVLDHLRFSRRSLQLTFQGLGCRLEGFECRVKGSEPAVLR